MKVALHGRRLRLVLRPASWRSRALRLRLRPRSPLAPSCERRTCRSPARQPPARPGSRRPPRPAVSTTRTRRSSRMSRSTPPSPTTSSRCSSRTAGTTAARTATSSSSRTTAARAGTSRASSRSSRSARGATGSPGFFDGRRTVGQLLVRREDRLRDRRLVQRERARLRRCQRDPRQPLHRRRRDVADAGDRALRRVDDGAERQGDRDRGSDRAEHRLRRLGSARLAEPEREPGRLQRLAGLPRADDVLEDDRRRRHLERGQVDLRAGPEEPDDRATRSSSRPPGRRPAS